jgi:hypothetical protein
VACRRYFNNRHVEIVCAGLIRVNVRIFYQLVDTAKLPWPTNVPRAAESSVGQRAARSLPERWPAGLSWGLCIIGSRPSTRARGVALVAAPLFERQASALREARSTTGKEWPAPQKKDPTGAATRGGVLFEHLRFISGSAPTLERGRERETRGALRVVGRLASARTANADVSPYSITSSARASSVGGISRRSIWPSGR